MYICIYVYVYIYIYLFSLNSMDQEHDKTWVSQHDLTAGSSGSAPASNIKDW